MFRFIIRAQMIFVSVKTKSVSVKFFARKLAILNNFLYLLRSQAEQHIFRFQVCMNDAADSVQKVKPHHHLSCDFFYQIEWKSFVVISLQNFQQVDTQDFKYHGEMISIWAFVQERVKQVENMTIVSVEGSFVRFVLFQCLYPFGIVCFLGYLLKDFYLII